MDDIYSNDPVLLEGGPDDKSGFEMGDQHRKSTFMRRARTQKSPDDISEEVVSIPNKQ